MTTVTLADPRKTPQSFALTQRGFQVHLRALVENISSVVVAPEQTIRFLLLSLMSEGHVLIEDTPGVGKTLIAKTLAQSIKGTFARVQCTPDLLPSDITGTSIFNLQESRFEFRQGPAFSNILLADEINRANPRTQAALLEAMGEFQVSADGVTYRLPRPFMVIGTQNMTESHGVFPLPDSQLDRFFICMSMGIPAAGQEVQILSRAEYALPTISPVMTAEDVVGMQEVIRQVSLSLPLKEYLVKLARASREHSAVARGVSPRGTVLLQRAAQAWAAFEERDFVIPEDVKRVAPLVLAHRMVPNAVAGLSQGEFVRELLDTVPVPL